MSGSRLVEVFVAVAGGERIAPGADVVLGIVSDVAAVAPFGDRAVADVRSEDVGVDGRRPAGVVLPGELVSVGPSTTVVLDPPVMCSSAPSRACRRSLVAF